MNGNPEGTPNPLNPNPVTPEAAPEPVTEPMEQTPVETTPVAPVQPAEQMTEAAESTVTESVPVNVAPAAFVAPTTPDPEPKDSIVEPAVKKKSGKKVVVILGILFLFIAIGCAVAAILILKPFGNNEVGEDAVPAAISKLMRETPGIVKIDGAINTTNNDPDGTTPEILVDLKAGFNSATTENYTNATVIVTADDGEDFNFSANEVHTSDGMLYLKVDGISEAIQGYYNIDIPIDCDTEETDCVEMLDTLETPSLNTDLDASYCNGDTTGSTYCDNTTGEVLTLDDTIGSAYGSLELLSLIDGEWFSLPDSNFTSINMGLNDEAKMLQCLTSAAGSLNKYGKDFADMYEKNPFVTYSTENIKVDKKKDAIYKLGFDAEQMAGFVNAINNSEFANELNTCMGFVATNDEVTADDLSEIIAEIPDIYVEIDDDYNFTRVYMEISDDTSETTVDLSFSYPESIQIEVPNNYMDATELLTQLLGDYETSYRLEGWIDCMPPLSENEAKVCAEAEASGYPYIAY